MSSNEEIAAMEKSQANPRNAAGTVEVHDIQSVNAAELSGSIPKIFSFCVKSCGCDETMDFFRQEAFIRCYDDAASSLVCLWEPGGNASLDHPSQRKSAKHGSWRRKWLKYLRAWFNWECAFSNCWYVRQHVCASLAFCTFVEILGKNPDLLGSTRRSRTINWLIKNVSLIRKVNWSHKHNLCDPIVTQQYSLSLHISILARWHKAGCSEVCRRKIVWLTRRDSSSWHKTQSSTTSLRTVLRNLDALLWTAYALSLLLMSISKYVFGINYYCDETIGTIDGRHTAAHLHSLSGLHLNGGHYIWGSRNRGWLKQSRHSVTAAGHDESII